MKKLIALSLVLIMVLSLCACGKSDEAKAVDETLAAIGEVTNDNLEEAEAAVAAYHALTDKDRESIENTEILERVQEEIFFVNYYNVVYSLDVIYHAAQVVTNSTEEIWDNVDIDEFWTCYYSVRELNLDMTKSEYDEYYGTNTEARIFCAALGLCPEKVDDIIDGKNEIMEDVIDMCVTFNQAYDLVEDMDSIAEVAQRIKKEYRDNYADEIDALDELCLEVSLYADFALMPSGSLANYISQDSDYQNTIDRLIKVMKTTYGYT